MDYPKLTQQDVLACLAYGGERKVRRPGARCGVKLLLDENLSRRIVPALQDGFPGFTQSFWLAWSDLMIERCGRDPEWTCPSEGLLLADALG
jgi:hypothetical protein